MRERTRRIVVQYDAHGQLGAPFDEWLDFRFEYIDQPGSQIDTIIWDIGWGSWAAHLSETLPRFEHLGLLVWWEQGIDWVAELVKETRARGLECLWNHRVSEVDINPLRSFERETELMMDHMNPVKAAHPDWVIQTWWWQGLWNYAVAEVREYQLGILREVATGYDVDGFQIDFARHIPVLPIGRQWKLRENVTEFMRMMRGMLAQAAEKRGRPYLLGARVPKTIRGCKADGLDVAAWAQEGLVDFLTLGSRSMSVDVEGFREAVGPDVKLQPCFDDHHATDGYRYQSIEFLRGVFANWWAQGADSVATFNWSNASAQRCREVISEHWGRGMFNEPSPDAHGQAYREVGDPEMLAERDKVFAVERRGGYPWAEGYFNRNDDAPLPLTLRYDGTAAKVQVRLSEATTADAVLRLVLFGAQEGDQFAVSLNGHAVESIVEDFEWKDAQLFCPAPQPASGGSGQYEVNPNQKLLRLDCRLLADFCRAGPNDVSVAIAARAPHCCGEISLEKVEVHAGQQ